VRQLTDMGLVDLLTGKHRHRGIRVTGVGRELSMPWPEHPTYPQHGYVVRRTELDGAVTANAVAAGATLLQDHEALRPLVARGFVRGAVVRDPNGESLELMAKYVVVADGANSRFGRSLGTFRAREWPYGTAIRSYWETPRSAEAWLESSLDLCDRNGHPVPGFGWVFPLGNGTANIGVGLLSTYRDFKGVNTTHLLESFAQHVAERWEIDPDRPTRTAVSGRVPIGGSVSPNAGPTYLVVGDACGAVNPFSGDGIAPAYETGRMAADVLHDALVTNDASALQQYSKRLESEYGLYFKTVALFASRRRPPDRDAPAHARRHAQPLAAAWVLRIMTNELRPTSSVALSWPTARHRTSPASRPTREPVTSVPPEN
jgi:flavin-dependent dehydrogenase